MFAATKSFFSTATDLTFTEAFERLFCSHDYCSIILSDRRTNLTGFPLYELRRIQTVFAQIVFLSSIKSFPLCSLSKNVYDRIVFTPAHFLFSLVPTHLLFQ